MPQWFSSEIAIFRYSYYGMKQITVLQYRGAHFDMTSRSYIKNYVYR